jgi:predicted anti-sigma-YlaC factor YlaD
MPFCLLDSCLLTGWQVSTLAYNAHLVQHSECYLMTACLLRALWQRFSYSLAYIEDSEFSLVACMLRSDPYLLVAIWVLAALQVAFLYASSVSYVGVDVQDTYKFQALLVTHTTPASKNCRPCIRLAVGGGAMHLCL